MTWRHRSAEAVSFLAFCVAVWIIAAAFVGIGIVVGSLSGPR